MNWFGSYPATYAIILTDPAVIDQSLLPYTGVAKVKILPPPDLFIPVLPYRCNGKLMFPLCRFCCETENQEQCNCDCAARALTATWATDEIKTAISRGYKILKVYEVYHYPEIIQYNRETYEGGLFKQYVTMFLKRKQEVTIFYFFTNYSLIFHTYNYIAILYYYFY